MTLFKLPVVVLLEDTDDLSNFYVIQDFKGVSVVLALKDTLLDHLQSVLMNYLCLVLEESLDLDVLSIKQSLASVSLHYLVVCFGHFLGLVLEPGGLIGHQFLFALLDFKHKILAVLSALVFNLLHVSFEEPS